MSNEQKPAWLAQVQQITAPAPVDGQSDTGAALAAVAEAMDEPFALNEVMGVVVDRGPGGIEYGVAVSTGAAIADVAKLAKLYAVTPDKVDLMGAAALLKERFQGVATCIPF